jgi:1,4-alpha-glucan branching enzyme
MGGASSGAMTMETTSGECRPAPPLGPEERRALLDGDCHDPHAVLGAHPVEQGMVVRALRPFADAVTVLTRDGGRWELLPEGDGLFAGVLPAASGIDYRFELQYADETVVADDPYRYHPTLGELDLHLISEGRHERLWEVLGARVRRFGETDEGAEASSGSETDSAPAPASASGSSADAGSTSDVEATESVEATKSAGAAESTPAAGSAKSAATSNVAAPTPTSTPTPTPKTSAADEAKAAQRKAALDAAFAPVTGVSFAVWAPNARGVRVIGDFNYWNGAAHPLRSLGGSGVWELFVPQTGAGVRYKYEILGRDGLWRQKADPLARRTEPPPGNASVTDDTEFAWSDDDWLAKRAATDPYRSPMSVYELHLQSWRPGLNYRQLAEEMPAYLLELGFTHVEFLPPTEHPFGGSWGYQVSSYFAPTARLGDPDDFRALIDALHAAGIGVFIDWVPAHFPKDAWALAEFDGTALYEHSDPRRGEHPDWGTLVFDYGRREVRNFLVASALFWCEQMHIDGLRVDAVASMLYLDYSREEGEWYPNAFGGRENLEAVSFLQELTATVYKRSPGVIVVAEESTAWPGVTLPTDHHVPDSALTGLGFGFKWNMGWMHDTLDYLAEDPINRRYHHHKMTFALVYAYTEKFVLAISHDEVVHGKGSLLRKMAGDRWQQMANVRAYLAFMWAHPGKQLLFSGCEFAQDAEWSEQHGLDWWLLDYPEHRGVFRTVQDLNRNYAKQPALWEQDHVPGGFEWLIVDDSDHNVFAFVRWSAQGRPLVCVVNFAAVPWNDYHLPLPLSAEQAPRWTELLNTDAEQYGGSGVGNFGTVNARAESWSGRPANAVLRLPPLGTLWLVPERADEPVSEREAEAAAELVAEAEQVAISAVEEDSDLVVDVLPGSAPEPVGELDEETEPEAEDEGVAEPELIITLAPEPELAVVPVTEPEILLAPVAEPELVSEPVVEPEIFLAPVAEPELVVEVAQLPEPEPAAEPTPEVPAAVPAQPAHSTARRDGMMPSFRTPSNIPAQSTDHSADGSADGSAGNSAEKPAEKPTDKSAKSADKPAGEQPVASLAASPAGSVTVLAAASTAAATPAAAPTTAPTAPAPAPTPASVPTPAAPPRPKPAPPLVRPPRPRS